MSARRSLDLNLIIGAVTLGAAVGVAFLLLLTALETPAGYKTRLADLKLRADNVESRLASQGQPYAYPAHALCADASAGAAALKDRLATAASAASVSLSNVSATPGMAPDNEAGLTPVKMSFEATGAYQSVLVFLDDLSKSEPEVFVDSADLKSQTSAASLTFQGKIYCSASARL